MKFAVILLTLFVSQTYSAEWSYSGEKGAQNWYKTYPTCGANKQSPIDIDVSKAEQKTIPQIVFSKYDADLFSSITLLENDGHSVKVSINGGDVKISAGDLPGTEFKLAQFHLHWGATDCRGSEHTSEGKHYPAELHLVHYNTKYTSLTEAVSHSDGLAVLGIFLDVGTVEHGTFKSLIEGFPTIKYKGEKYSNLKSFTMQSLLPKNTNDFVRYEGSLTTPGCNEAVTWTVFKESVKISQPQLNSLRALSQSERGQGSDIALVDNYRPVLPLNGRKVYKTFTTWDKPVPKTTCSASSLSAMATGFLTLFILLDKFISYVVFY